MKPPKHTRDDLIQMQSMPLEAKIVMSQNRIREWYEHWNGDVYVSFSGGKDSTVLLHLVRQIYPYVPAIFCNTGLENPTIQKFAKSFDNVTVVTPPINFRQVLTQFGYPLVSKDVANAIEGYRNGREWAKLCMNGFNTKTGELCDYNLQRWAKWNPLIEIDTRVSAKCCRETKEKALIAYARATKRKPFVGILASESTRRTKSWMQTGCNAFESGNKSSKPIAFWREQDVLRYIYETGLPIAECYGDVKCKKTHRRDIVTGKCEAYYTTGESRTGCMFCLFGAHCDKAEKPRLVASHEAWPRQYEYMMNGGEYDDQGMWIPNGKGLGMAHVIDEFNRLMDGKARIEY